MSASAGIRRPRPFAGFDERARYSAIGEFKRAHPWADGDAPAARQQPLPERDEQALAGHRRRQRRQFEDRYAQPGTDRLPGLGREAEDRRKRNGRLTEQLRPNLIDQIVGALWHVQPAGKLERPIVKIAAEVRQADRDRLRRDARLAQHIRRQPWEIVAPVGHTHHQHLVGARQRVDRSARAISDRTRSANRRRGGPGDAIQTNGPVQHAQPDRQRVCAYGDRGVRGRRPVRPRRRSRSSRASV